MYVLLLRAWSSKWRYPKKARALKMCQPIPALRPQWLKAVIFETFLRGGSNNNGWTSSLQIFKSLMLPLAQQKFWKPSFDASPVFCLFCFKWFLAFLLFAATASCILMLYPKIKVDNNVFISFVLDRRAIISTFVLSNTSSWSFQSFLVLFDQMITVIFFLCSTERIFCYNGYFKGWI